MLKKWFISAFPEIEKISQTLAPKLCQKLWKIEILTKMCIASAKPHRSVFRLFARYYDAEEVIHQDFLKLRRYPLAPKLCQKLWKIEILTKIVSDPPHRSVFRFSQDITMLKKWFISAFPEIEKISQTLAPKLCQKLWKIELLMKRCIGSAKPHRSVFRLFARYYEREVIHQRISEIEKISQTLAPYAKNYEAKILRCWRSWTFNEKVHRIRKTSQSRFSLFCKILRCWRSDSSAHFLKSRRYLKLWPQSYAKNYEKLNF